MTREFNLIDTIVATLGAAQDGPGVVLGPGDDAALLALEPGEQLVTSVDTLVENLHFPAAAPPERIARRALGVAVSDLAAMGARPLGALVAAVLPPNTDARWVRAFAAGLAEPAKAWGCPVIGGNLARGPCAISVTVLGAVPAGAALLRAGARPGDQVWVSGPLGGAALALAEGAVFEPSRYAQPGCERYFEPQPRLKLGVALREFASAAIDVSDGLAADLSHLAQASSVQLALRGDAIPRYPGASLEQALHGGDDYELAFTRAASEDAGADARWRELTSAMVSAGMTLTLIGDVLAPPAGDAFVLLDGAPLAARGFDHFG